MKGEEGRRASQSSASSGGLGGKIETMVESSRQIWMSSTHTAAKLGTSRQSVKKSCRRARMHTSNP